jgi:hypothetical protein
MTESITRVSTSGIGNAGDIPTGESFAKTPIGAVLRNTNLSDGAVRLYAELRSYAWGEDGRCFPGQKTLGEDMGWSRSKVCRYTKELKDADLIEIEYRPLHKGKNKPNLYTLNQPSTSGTDVSSLTHRDVSSLTHEVDLVEVDIPPKPPKTGGTEEKEKGKAGTGTAGTASFGAKPDPAQNRAGQGRVKERSPRKRRSRAGTVQTPGEGLQALTDHRDRLGGASMERYVPVAKRWDFTEDNPPWWVMKDLDNDHKKLDRIEKIVRGAIRKAEVDALNAKKERGHVSPDSTLDAPVQASPSLADPNSVEAIVSADKAQEAEDAALLKAYMKAYPERCTHDSF